jgi:hypothetical protein
MDLRRSPDKKTRLEFTVYLAGDNNLADEMVWNLQEMKAAASEPHVREGVDVEALFDPFGRAPRRYDFKASAAEPGSLPAGKPVRPKAEDPATLLKQLVAHRPEGRRVVVLSGHGSGAIGDFLDDKTEAAALSIPRLGKILEKTRTDILGLDSCQMSTVEVSYQVRGSVAYLVASEGPVLNTGWPYRQVLTSVAEKRAESSEAIARAIAESYLRFYRDYEIAGVATDIAVTDLSKIEPVGKAVRELARAMREPLSKLAADGLDEPNELEGNDPDNASRALRDVVVLAHWSAQSYKCDRYTDLSDFARELLRFSSSRSGPAMDNLRKAARGVLQSVDAAVRHAGTTGAELQHSHGLSIYFPWSSRDFFPEYGNLKFAAETGWKRFLEVYLRATRRMRRFQASNLGRENVPRKPLRTPEPETAFSGIKDVEAGTRKDVEAGTRKGLACRSTMKNPPDGYYPRPSGDDAG